MSTRAPLGARVPLVDAIALGMAPDGGLFMPERIPEVPIELTRPLGGVEGLRRMLDPDALGELAWRLLTPYFEGESIADDLLDICSSAFDFPLSTRFTGDDEDVVLELFHGPTAAFKDFGARFLAECLSRVPNSGEQTVLVATSGDTGAAVAAAFANRPGFRVVVLYPDGRVSARQAHQLGAFGDTVHAYAVAGTFDDCQRLVKQAFADEALRDALQLRSANSISLGRLLPQMAYYAYAALGLQSDGPVSFVIPTGNLGNAFACVMARAMGLPIDKIVLATNANHAVVDWVRGAPYTPIPSVTTLANAMDVGAPSNAERLAFLYPDARSLAAAVSADWVDDDTIRATIARTFRETGDALCPHTACGVEVLRRLRAEGATGTYVVAATAHAAKFEGIVEPLIGTVVEPPPQLAALLARPSHATRIPVSYAELTSALR